jgi:hypothetical protein
LESERVAAAAKEAELRRPLGPQMVADAEHLIAAWNARQERHTPMLFSPTISAAIAAHQGSCGWLVGLPHHQSTCKKNPPIEPGQGEEA